MEKNKVSLHRVLTASPEKVFRAFSDPHAQASWIPPYGFVCQVHEFDFRVGGRYRMSFTNFSTGNSHTFGGEFLEIKANEYLRYSDKFEDPGLPGEMTTEVWISKALPGTDLRVVQSGIPDAIPTDMCYLGWQESLDKLKRLVEPEIPDA